MGNVKRKLTTLDDGRDVFTSSVDQLVRLSIDNKHISESYSSAANSPQL
jgi:hypothetical protein